MNKEQEELLVSLKGAIEAAYQAGKEDAARDRALIAPADLYTMLHCTIGYALGRKTYITSLVPEIVKTYWQHLPIGVQDTLLRNLSSDIAVYDRSHRKIGDDCDDRSWRELQQWMRERVAPETL